MFIETTKRANAETLFQDLQNDELWSDGTELDRLAGEYWDARQAHDDERASAVWAQMDAVKPKREKRQTDEGGTLYQIGHMDPDGDGWYHFRLGDGWEPMDTDQDAWYFGVWTNDARRYIYTYAEGDISLEVYPDAETYRAGVANARAYYRKEV